MPLYPRSLSLHNDRVFKILAGATFTTGIILAFTSSFNGGLAVVIGSVWLWTSGEVKVRKPGFRLFLEAAIQPVLIVAIVLWLLLAAMGVSFDENDEPLLPDFIPLYASGALLLESPPELYDTQRQLEAERKATGLDLGPENFLPFAYPPFVALFFMPFTLLPFESAYKLFQVLNLAFLGAALHLISRRLKLAIDHVRVLGLICFSLMSVYIGLVQGQTTFMGLLVMSLFFLELREGRDVPAGVWGGLLWFKPQFAIVPFLIILCRKRWTAGFVCVATTILLAGLSAALIGLDAIYDFFELVKHLGSGAEPTANPLNMYNLKAVSFFLGLENWSWILASLVLVGVLLKACRIDDEFIWSPAAAVIAIILISAHTNPHDLVFVLLTLGLALSTRKDPIESWSLRGLFLLAVLPLAMMLLSYSTAVKWPVVPIVLTALFVACVKGIPRRISGRAEG